MQDAKDFTVADAVARHFRGVPFTHNGEGTRLFGHDFLHTLLGTRTNSDRAEEVVAIYQAVLLGDAQVSTRPDKQWRNFGPPPALEEVMRVTIPGARRFVNDTVEKLKRDHIFDSAMLEKLAERPRWAKTRYAAITGAPCNCALRWKNVLAAAWAIFPSGNCAACLIRNFKGL